MTRLHGKKQTKVCFSAKKATKHLALYEKAVTLQSQTKKEK